MEPTNQETPSVVQAAEGTEIEKDKPINNEQATEKKEEASSVVEVPEEQPVAVKFLSLSQVFFNSLESSL